MSELQRTSERIRINLRRESLRIRDYDLMINLTKIEKSFNKKWYEFWK